jgi:hypothetical protein
MSAHKKILLKLRFSLFLAIAILHLPFITPAQTVGGIGAMLSMDSLGGYTLPFVKGVVPNTPAAKSLKENLFIQSVDGISCKNKSLDEIVALIRGVIGSSIKITVSDDKMGLFSNSYDLVRAGITTGAPAAAPPPDPVAAFNTDCAAELKKIHKMGFKVIKTYNSECGNFFFNFDSQNGLFHVGVYYLSEKDYQLSADVFDNKYFDKHDESNSVKLQKKNTKDFNGMQVSELNGDISFTKDGVGVVGIKVPADNSGKCAAVYVVVYK